MVARQQPLHTVHDPRVDELLCRDALNLLKNPGVIAFNVLALLFTLYHAFTWFYLIGKVQPIKMGKTTSKPWQALLVNIVLLLIVSFAVIEILVLR